MFQCIIQQSNSWNQNTQLKDFYPDIRIQLAEQLRCLDSRVETQVAIVTEIQDFFRRRAEVELDYSKSLDKLVKSLQLRHKEQKQKREQWSLFSTYSCWQQLISQTRNLSRDHAALSEIYSIHIVSRLSQVIEDVQRIYRRCREIGYDMHDEILRVLHELHTALKTYQAYQGECSQAETKLQIAEAQRHKIEQGIPKEKLDRSKKFKMIEKEVQKRKNKYFDAKLKALKARNEYVLCIEATNTTLHKYYVDDISDLIDCMDLGFHHCMTRALRMHVTSEEGRQKSIQNSVDALNSAIAGLDSRLDKQRFLEYNHTAFMIPKKLEFQGKKDEAEPELQKLLCADMGTRLAQMKTRIDTVRAQSDEIWKTLETAEGTLLNMLSPKDYDCSQYFGEKVKVLSKPLETVSIKIRADRHETEEFYLSKLRDFMLGTSRIARLDAKYEHMRGTLAELSACPLEPVICPTAVKPPRKRIGRFKTTTPPKLFGGSLEEYVESTNQEIPLIVRSCIRLINLYGLHHQGIFRVSGSQVEINNFRDAFERGEDPLAEITDASDMNSVAGVLKLYLRELREPLFPIIYFEQFMELGQLESKTEFVIKMKDLIHGLPRSVVTLMRYLFAFLNHLSEYSDENMMDPYNLAICFGPTLVPVPEDRDQVQYQNQVNELIKNIILFHDEIFPTDIGGITYEKYISRELDDNDVGDSPSENAPEDLDSEVYPSEDECECVEATAQFDFQARSERELSLAKGDSVTLFNQVSCDWWQGAVSGKEGLVPDKYISIKMRDEMGKKGESWEIEREPETNKDSIERRTSASNDSVLSSSSNSPPIEPPSWLPQQQKELSCESLVSGEESINEVLLSEGTDSQEIQTSQKPQKTHWKSQSVGEIPSGSIHSDGLNQSRESWQSASYCSLASNNNKDARDIKHIHTPDLVMDLPMTSEVNKIESPDPDSPDMTTAAERFAKQNQCTLKKNTKVAKPDIDATPPPLQPKPTLKAKPQIMKKPIVLPQSPLVAQKDVPKQ